MNEPKRIPITDAKTGFVRYSDPVSQHGPRAPAPVPSSEVGPPSAEAQSAVGEQTTDPAAAADLPSGAKREETSTAGSVAKSKPDIETFGQFLAYAYSRRGQKVPLKAKVERAIAQQPRLAPEEMERIANLVKEDVTFAVPRQLLLASRSVQGYPGLRGAIGAFVRDVMLSHPLFQSPKVEAAVRNLDDAPRPEEVLRFIAEFDRKQLPAPTADALKSSEFDELRLNATNCMAVWLADVKGLSAVAVADALFLSLWRPKAMTLEQEASKLRAITEVDELGGVGFVCEEFRRQAVEKHAQAEAAAREASALQQRLSEVEKELVAAREQLDGYEVTVRDLKVLHAETVSSIKRAGETEATHLRDDHETLRTRVLRRLKADVDLLELGLQALRRPEPKVHVMLDSAERVADALRVEIKNLQGES